MISEELKEYIINDFEGWYLENEEEMKNQDILKTISIYVSGLYWDLRNTLEETREEFGISQDLEWYDALCEIEDIITKTLIESEVG